MAKFCNNSTSISIPHSVMVLSHSAALYTKKPCNKSILYFMGGLSKFESISLRDVSPFWFYKPERLHPFPAPLRRPFLPDAGVVRWRLPDWNPPPWFLQPLPQPWPLPWQGLSRGPWIPRCPSSSSACGRSQQRWLPPNHVEQKRLFLMMQQKYAKEINQEAQGIYTQAPL